jgi:hypothetical protein
MNNSLARIVTIPKRNPSKYLVPARMGLYEEPELSTLGKLRTHLKAQFQRILISPQKFPGIEPQHIMGTTDVITDTLRDVFWRPTSFAERKRRVNNLGVVIGTKTPESMYAGVANSSETKALLTLINEAPNAYTDGARALQFIHNPHNRDQIICLDEAHVDFWIASPTPLVQRQFYDAMRGVRDRINKMPQSNFEFIVLGSPFIHGQAYTCKWRVPGKLANENRHLLSKGYRQKLSIQDLERLYATGRGLQETNHLELSQQLLQTVRYELSQAFQPKMNEIPDTQSIRGMAFM